MKGKRSIFFISLANQDAYDKFKKTMLRSVKTSTLPGSTTLKNYDRLHIWGLQYYGQNEEIWNRIKKNDILFFYREKMYVCSAIVEGTEDNLHISNHLWGESTSNLVQRGFLVYMMPDNVVFSRIPSSSLNQLFGYMRPNWLTDSGQAFHPDDRRLEDVEKEFGSLENALEKIGISFRNKFEQTMEGFLKNENNEKIIPENEPRQLSNGLVGPSGYTANDRWTTEDALGYWPYAYAISKFLTHKNTIPPLTISIQAPWGGGKTSIMRMVQEQLDSDAVEKLNQITSNEIPDNTESAKKSKDNLTLKTIVEVLENKIDLPITKIQTRPKKSENSGRITVWFNAWRYENTTQIWAGLAYAIIKQILEKIDKEDQERFWCVLNKETLENANIHEKINRRIHDNWLNKIKKWIIPYSVGIGVISIPLISGIVNGLTIGISSASVVISLLHGIKQYFSSKKEIEDEPAKKSLSKFLQAPNYEENLGFVHLVEEDLRAVFNAVDKKYLPLVIFIDDLDRCSPQKVAEIIEAINRFLSAELPNCLFVLGIDAEMVAASLESAHESIIQKLPNYAKRNPIGWRFMDKFVQLPVLIPPPEHNDEMLYIQSLITRKNMSESDSKIYTNTENPESEMMNLDNKKMKDATSNDNIIQKSQGMSNNEKIQQMNVEKNSDEIISKYSDNDPTTREIIEKYKDYFSKNPRELKRFVNMYRFQFFLRTVKENRRKEQGMLTPLPSLDQIARWIVLSLRWPDAVRWVQQGSGEVKVLMEEGIESEDNVKERLELLEHYAEKFNRDDWRKSLQHILDDQTKITPWTLDEDFRTFFVNEAALAENKNENESLSKGAGWGIY